MVEAMDAWRCDRRHRQRAAHRSATSPARCLPSRPRARSRCAAWRPALRDRRSGGRGTRCRIRLLIRPARGPCSWWLMPPVPQICTFRSSSKDSTARRIALPSVEAALARWAAGYCTTLTASGITGQGQASGWPNSSDSGTVRPWSTSILLTMVRSNRPGSRDLRDMRRPVPDGPCTTGTGRGPQPSSAGGNSAAQPIAKVGIMLQTEGGGMVVVDQDDDVRLVALPSMLGELEAIEDRFPIGLVASCRDRARRRWPARARCRRCRP